MCSVCLLHGCGFGKKQLLRLPLLPRAHKPAAAGALAHGPGASQQPARVPRVRLCHLVQLAPWSKQPRLVSGQQPLHVPRQPKAMLLPRLAKHGLVKKQLAQLQRHRELLHPAAPRAL